MLISITYHFVYEPFFYFIKKIKDCKKVIGLNYFIKVKFYENIIKSNKKNCAISNYYELIYIN